MIALCLAVVGTSACGTIPTTDAQNVVLRAKPVEDAVVKVGFTLQCTNQDAANGVLRDNTYPWRDAYFVGKAADIGAVIDTITDAGFTFEGKPHRDLATLPTAVSILSNQAEDDTSVALDYATDAAGASWYIAYYRDKLTLECSDVNRWGTVVHLKAGEVGLVTSLSLPELN